MRGLIEWVKGWTTTIDLYLHNRELYEILRQPLNKSDFDEVGRP